MFLRRSLTYYRLESLAVMLGVAVGAAVLTGSIIVGDSVRGSLRDEALGRLGRIDFAGTSANFFRDDWGGKPWSEFPGSVGASLIAVRGGAVHSDSGARVNRTSILGVDEAFWKLDPDPERGDRPVPTGREVVLNQSLADGLGASVGDAVVLRLGKASPIATDTLLGRRDDVTTCLRLTVKAIVPDGGLGSFSLRPKQQSARNAFVSRELLQRQLNQTGRANVVLLGAASDDASPDSEPQKQFDAAVQSRLTLADVGLTLRVDDAVGYVALESNRLLIEPGIETLAESVARDLDISFEPIKANLANAIRIHRDGKATGIPYSTVVALPANGSTVSSMQFSNGNADLFGQGKILLNDWAIDALGAAVGEQVELTYYLLEDEGELKEETASFELVGSVAMSGAAIDQGLAPSYPGITDAEKVSDWDPPFPVDLSKIKPRDDEYWERYRATPKAFIEQSDGLRMWQDTNAHHGRFTSIRFRPNDGSDLATFANLLRDRLTHGLALNVASIRTLSVRAEALAAGKGSTDFGVLFMSFGFFLLASAGMLVMLLFRLNVERRTREMGLLAGVGFSNSRIRRIFLSEGAVIATVGSVVGLLGALAYSWMMLSGLKTWWAGAVNAPFLKLHWAWMSVAFGVLASIVVSLGSIAWAQRGSLSISAAALLAGAGHERVRIRHDGGGNRWIIVAVLALIGAVAIGVWGLRLDGIQQAGAFFGSGSATLIGVLCIFGAWMRASPSRLIGTRGTWMRLGLRNAGRHPGRSLLTSALIASGAFLVLSLQSFRLNARGDESGIHTASGGFALIAESDVSLPYSLATEAGRASLGLSTEDNGQLSDASIIACALRPGDETSCQSLYVPNQPRILGVPDTLIDRGGFRFSAVTESDAIDRDNPWTALRTRFDDGAIPVIADEAVVKWQLHSGLSRDIVITDERGNDVQLRFVALLGGSTLQSELIVSAENFERLFPRRTGGAFFLIDAPKAELAQVESTLEQGLADYGFDSEKSVVRLQDYFAVQNTYLSTFQTLGGMGLVLGSFGLTAVLLRNVWERRRELALMRALGFSQMKLAMGVLTENVILVVIGFLAALIAAAVAVLPHMINRVNVIPWTSLVWIVTGVFGAGVAVSFLAIIPTLRSSMLGSLRRE